MRLEIIAALTRFIDEKKTCILKGCDKSYQKWTQYNLAFGAIQFVENAELITKEDAVNARKQLGNPSW